jgi:hypothetical protein
MSPHPLEAPLLVRTSVMVCIHHFLLCLPITDGFSAITLMALTFFNRMSGDQVMPPTTPATPVRGAMAASPVTLATPSPVPNGEFTGANSVATRATTSTATISTGEPHFNYPSLRDRYKTAISIDDFCERYSLETAKDKIVALGFRVGDRVEDMAAVERADWSGVGLTVLQWNGLLRAIENYWETLLVK